MKTVRGAYFKGLNLAFTLSHNNDLPKLFRRTVPSIFTDGINISMNAFSLDQISEAEFRNE